jgi:competence protein ComEA
MFAAPPDATGNLTAAKAALIFSPIRRPRSRKLMKVVSPAVLIGAALAAVAGAIFLIARESPSGGIEIVLPTPAAAGPIDLKVYVSGAVREPGFYEASPGHRLEDVVNMAGGPSSDADLDAINLATRVRDEDHWHIPRIGEEPQAAAGQQAGGSGRIDLNSADVGLLDTLPGIGEVKAQAIVKFRESNGPFATVDDLLAVSGIGPATLESIRDLVDAR